MNNPNSSAPDAVEAFNLRLDWFLGHALSLSMSAEDCCIDQGHYRVAGELFYFLVEKEVLSDPASTLSSEQKAAIKRLQESVTLVPVEARSGGTTAEASLADMSHPSWDEPRRRAAELRVPFAALWPQPAGVSKPIP